MKITNKYNLPEAICQAVKAWNYPPTANRYSVTELIAPPLIRKLKIQHWNELEEDASDRLWVLLGQAVHSVLDKVKIEDALQEEKLIAEFNGASISGRIDLYRYNSKSIEDYKITSVWAFMLGDKPEWEAQLNVYRWLYERYNFEVKQLKINAILRDWKQSEALKNTDYPPIPFISVNIPLWTSNEVEEYIASRLKKHEEGASCTNEERWLRNEQWAVVKAGNKKALRLFDNIKDAESFITEQEKNDKSLRLELQYRAGQYMRCESYCPVRTVCTEKKTNEISDRETKGEKT